MITMIIIITTKAPGLGKTNTPSAACFHCFKIYNAFLKYEK